MTLLIELKIRYQELKGALKLVYTEWPGLNVFSDPMDILFAMFSPNILLCLLSSVSVSFTFSEQYFV